MKKEAKEGEIRETKDIWSIRINDSNKSAEIINKSAIITAIRDSDILQISVDIDWNRLGQQHSAIITFLSSTIRKLNNDELERKKRYDIYQQLKEEFE